MHHQDDMISDILEGRKLQESQKKTIQRRLTQLSPRTIEKIKNFSRSYSAYVEDVLNELSTPHGVKHIEALMNLPFDVLSQCINLGLFSKALKNASYVADLIDHMIEFNRCFLKEQENDRTHHHHLHDLLDHAKTKIHHFFHPRPVPMLTDDDDDEGDGEGSGSLHHPLTQAMVEYIQLSNQPMENKSEDDPCHQYWAQHFGDCLLSGCQKMHFKNPVSFSSMSDHDDDDDGRSFH